MSRRTSRAVTLLAILLDVLGATPPAVAQQVAASSVDEATREQAGDLYRRGHELYVADRFDEALALLDQSYQLYPTWATSYALALCEDKLEHSAAALRLYERALAEGAAEIPADRQARLLQRIDDLRRSLDLASLSVVSSPPGARIALDRGPWGTTPFTAAVGAGEHVVRLTLDGYEVAEQSVSLAVGESRTIEVTLVALVEPPVVPVAGQGRLAVTADEPGCRVLIDGLPVGITPLPPTDVAVGERRVRVEGRDRSWEDAVQVPADRSVRVNVTLGGGVDQGWFWGIAATAAAAGVGWAATGGYAWSLYDEYQGASAERRDEIRPTANSAYDAADALFGIAAGAAVAALVLAFYTDFGDGPAADVSVDGTGPEASGDTTATSGLASW
jgi:tetratricopeptide (TPR) repeat protein